MIRNASDGAAEALYGLGGAGTTPGRRTGGADLSAPGAVPAARPRSRGGHRRQSASRTSSSSDAAIHAYELVPADSPMRESAEIQVGARARRARPQRRGDDADAATSSPPIPTTPTRWSALGSLQRSAKNFDDAANSYDKAIALVGAPDRSNWTLFYFRGICFERSKQWPKAEADFKKALELYPDQPLVLNYLGYSWVDQGVNLDEAFKMLRRAVDLQADRRLHRRQPRLGALQARPLPGGDRGAGKGDRAQAGRSGRQRPPRRRLLARRPQASKRISSGTTRAT